MGMSALQKKGEVGSELTHLPRLDSAMCYLPRPPSVTRGTSNAVERAGLAACGRGGAVETYEGEMGEVAGVKPRGFEAGDGGDPCQARRRRTEWQWPVGAFHHTFARLMRTNLCDFR